MKEEQLFDPMIAYLKEEGYSILEQHRGYEHGTDIVATKDDYKFLLELKGDSVLIKLMLSNFASG